jgi:lysozyme family protein
MADFDKAVALVLKHEGGYTAGLPNDPGGETNFGISKRAYSNLDIKALTSTDAAAIYKRDYWTSQMEVSEQGLANCMLDCAVNQGPGALKSILVWGMTLQQFQLVRLLRYTKSNPAYYHAWFARTLDV